MILNSLLFGSFVWVGLGVVKRPPSGDRTSRPGCVETGRACILTQSHRGISDGTYYPKTKGPAPRVIFPGGVFLLV